MKNKLLESAFTFAQEAIIITDEQQNIVDINAAMQQITGYSKAELIGQKPKIFNLKKQGKVLRQTIWQALQRYGCWYGEVANRRKDGTYYVGQLRIKRLNISDKIFYLGYLTDISNAKKHQETPSADGSIHYLEQIVDREQLRQQYQAMRLAAEQDHKQLVIAFMDLDAFTTVNELYGRALANKLLHAIPQRIRSVLAETDSITRYSGDQFVLMLGAIHDPQQVLDKLNTVLRAVNHPFVINNLTMRVSASIGYTFYRNDNASLEKLLRQANRSMHNARLSGKYSLFAYDPAEQAQIAARNQQLAEISKGLKSEQFELFYQPKVTLSTGDLFGFEALIRWNHPEKGMLTPDKFIEQLYETDLEVNLGQWVINQALRQLAEWQQAGYDYQLSINLTAYHLSSADFFEWLNTHIQQYPQLDTKQFQIEILESNRLSDLKLIASVMKRCKSELGITIALDDFGTAYSSLTHIRTLPVDVVKIDKSFVCNMLVDPEDCKIVEGIIALAQSFNICVIAEGVETVAHGRVLLAMGCDQVQGYAVSRPLTRTQLTEFVRNYQPITAWCEQAELLTNQKLAWVSLFNFYLHAWVEQLQQRIFADPDTNIDWPISNPADSHCGIWLGKPNIGHQIDDNTRQQLRFYHQSIFRIGNGLLTQYRAGEIEASRAGYNAQRDSIHNTLAQLQAFTEQIAKA